MEKNKENMIEGHIQRITDLIQDTYPEAGTFQDVDTATLTDGTIQFMFYFSKGSRAAWQTGWDTINMERYEDIPYSNKEG